MPESKPYDKYVLQEYPIHGRAPSRITEAKPLTNARQTRLFWELPRNPDPGQIDKVTWTW